jgi:hypothetical protein
VPAPFDVLAAEDLLRPKLIVSAATHSEILGFVRPSEGLWLGMIELQKRASFAAPTVFGDERALDAVALEHSAARRPGDSLCVSLSRRARFLVVLLSSEAFSFEIRK